MELTKEQRQLLKLASKEVKAVLSGASQMDSKYAAWTLWYAYDAVSNVYHQIRDAAIDEKAAKETK